MTINQMLNLLDRITTDEDEVLEQFQANKIADKLRAAEEFINSVTNDDLDKKSLFQALKKYQEAGK